MDNTLSGYLSSLHRDGGKRLGQSISTWALGIQPEVDFWSNWFADREGRWPDEYQQRTSPIPLVPWVENLLPQTAEGRIATVLDVGSGPLTLIGSHSPNRDVEVRAVDPLAHQYAEIAKKNGVTPPVVTEMGFSEDLSCRFDAGYFDVVTCTNALDHAIEPMWGILEIFIITRSSGAIKLAHQRNEAVKADYDGFHQWNMEGENGHFILWNKSHRIDVTRIMSDVASVETCIEGEAITVLINKQRDLDLDLLDYQRKLRAGLLEALFT